MSGYRPTRSQQICIESALRKRHNIDSDWHVTIHHVLEDTPIKGLAQVEMRRTVIKIDYIETSDDQIKSINDLFGPYRKPTFLRMEF